MGPPLQAQVILADWKNLVKKSWSRLKLVLIIACQIVHCCIIGNGQLHWSPENVTIGLVLGTSVYFSVEWVKLLHARPKEVRKYCDIPLQFD